MRAMQWAMVAAVVTVVVARPALAEETAAKRNPWAGSLISYEHSFSALSLDKGADPDYNPYYVQALTLAPQWSLGEQFYLRGGFVLQQELTDADDTEGTRQIVWSDVTLDAGYTGWTEENSKVRVAGSVRLILPVSERSAFEQLNLGIMPGVSAARKFDVLQGLSVGYGGRFTWYWRAGRTAKYDGPKLESLSGIRFGSDDTGRGVTSYSIAHGPTVALAATEKLSFSTMYLFNRARAFDVIDDDDVTRPPGSFMDDLSLDDSYDNLWRDAESFVFEAAYQVADPLGVAVGVNTTNRQQADDGQDNPRFFNRYTAFYVGLNVDVDAASKLF